MPVKISSNPKTKIRKKNILQGCLQTASTKPEYILYLIAICLMLLFAVGWFIRIINLRKEGKRISFIKYKKKVI